MSEATCYCPKCCEGTEAPHEYHLERRPMPVIDLAKELDDCGRDIATNDLAVEIADESAVYQIERYARRFDLGVWDITAPDDLELRDECLQEVQRDIERAVKYLELRGKVNRPFQFLPHLVTIKREG